MPSPPRALLVGAGGVGAPGAWALAAHGGITLVVADDDDVAISNLHRQILFEEADVGRPKIEALSAALSARFPGVIVEGRAARATPGTVHQLVSDVDIVLDGTDNFASRFLLADACALAGKAIVHAAAVQWRGTCFVSGPGGAGPCYRCLFEDLPEGPAPDCAGAGVAGPVCGVIGGIAADAIVRALAGDSSVLGTVASFDGRAGRLRRVPVKSRPGCLLCGRDPSIESLDGERYQARSCEGV